MRSTRLDDHGATAILTAILASLLFVMAALAVDLTNAFARRAATQGSADTAARDGAALLPDSCAAVAAATTSLADPANAVIDDAQAGPATPLAGALNDGDEANGEITVYGPDLDGDPLTDEPRLTTCVDYGSRIRVVAPPVRVSFGFARSFGPDGVDVRARATAQVASVLPLLPFAISQECAGDGPKTLALRPPAAATPVPTAGTGSPLILTDAVAGTDGILEVDVSADPRPGVVGYWIQLSASTSRGPLTVAIATTTALPDATGSRRVQATLPDQVRLQPGQWSLAVGGADTPAPAAPPAGQLWSGSVEVAVPSGVPVPACDATGVYGQVMVFVPNGPGVDAAERTGLATLSGVALPLGDPAAAATISCPPAGSRTCVTLAGNQAALADAVQAAMITRLRPSSAPCEAPGEYLGRWRTRLGSLRGLNSAACYFEPDPLAGGWRVRVDDDITASEVVADPKLFLLPVVALPTVSRPTTDAAVPVVGYVAAFITNETPESLAAGVLATNCRPRGLVTCNGIELTPGRDGLSRLTLYTFDPEVLPATARLTDNGHPFTAGPVDVMLVPS